MVSIIVPVFNAKKYIETAIRSVLLQTFTDWELILVDDASTDGSADLIASVISAHPDQRIRLIRLPGNSGAAAARNRSYQPPP